MAKINKQDKMDIAIPNLFFQIQVVKPFWTKLRHRVNDIAWLGFTTSPGFSF